jgi:hypothetical protein
MILTKPIKSTIEVDLTGPQGNAFYLLGLAKSLSVRYSLDGVQVQKEMTAGDYENLIEVFDNYFGGIVTLFR